MPAHPRPTTLLSGMNQFLKSLEITFRRDSQNYRPRINKMHSVKVRVLPSCNQFISLVVVVVVVGCRSKEIRKLLLFRNLGQCSNFFKQSSIGTLFLICIYNSGEV